MRSTLVLLRHTSLTLCLAAAGAAYATGTTHAPARMASSPVIAVRGDECQADRPGCAELLAMKQAAVQYADKCMRGSCTGPQPIPVDPGTARKLRWALRDLERRLRVEAVR